MLAEGDPAVEEAVTEKPTADPADTEDGETALRSHENGDDLEEGLTDEGEEDELAEGEQEDEESEEEEEATEAALHDAAARGNMHIVKSLVGRGVDVECVASNGGTALMKAACNGHIDIVKYLVNEQKAAINAVDVNGVNAFMLASMSGAHWVLPFLTESRADVNATTHKGFTALMFAAQQGRLPAVRLLVETCGADLTARISPERLNLTNPRSPSITVSCSNCRHYANASTELEKKLNLQCTHGLEVKREKMVCGVGNRFICENCLAGYTAMDFAAQRGHTELVLLFNELDPVSPEALRNLEAAEKGKHKRNVSASRKKDIDERSDNSSVSHNKSNKGGAKAKGKK